MDLHQKIKELKQKSGSISYRDIASQVQVIETRETNLDKRIVEGYGVIWGTVNTHREMFLRGAFAKSIRDMGPGSNSNYEIKFREKHYDEVSLFDELREDEIGLYFRTKELPNDEQGNRIIDKIRRKVWNNFSIGYRWIWDKMEWNSDEEYYIIREANLLEISVVGIPSDMSTYALRSGEQLEDLYDDTEDFILSLPRKNQLQARQLFAAHKALYTDIEPHQHNRSALNTVEPQHEKSEGSGLDLGYISEQLSNLKFI